MDIKINQRVYIIVPASIYGIIAKEAFQIVAGSYIHENNGYYMIKVELLDDNIGQTVIPMPKNNVFISMKDAIDKACSDYNERNNNKEDGVDKRSEPSLV